MSEQTAIAVGLIGCGQYGRQVHLPILLTMPQFRVVAMCNRSPDHLKEAATAAHQAGFEPKTGSDWKRVVEDPDVHAVIAMLPPSFNLPIIRRCAELKKPVFVEKPVAVSEQDLAELADLAQHAPMHIQVGTQLLHGAWFTELETVIRRKGDLLALNAQVYLNDGWAFSPMTWKVDAEHCGGILNSWGVHPLTMLLRLSSLPTEGADAGNGVDYAELVAFTGSAFEREGVDPAMYDTASIAWMTVSGEAAVPCQLQIALHPDVEAPRWRIEAICSDGRVEGELFSRVIQATRRGGAARTKTLDAPPGPGFDGNRQQLEHFARCIREKHADLSSLHLNLLASRMALEVNVNPTQDE